MPKLDYGKSTAEVSLRTNIWDDALSFEDLCSADEQLQEELHAAQSRLTQRDDEVAQLQRELARRPVDVDGRIEELQDEVGQLKMIAGMLSPSHWSKTI